MAAGNWTSIVSATTAPGGGSVIKVNVLMLGVEGYEDVYSDTYGGGVAPEEKSGGSTFRVTVSLFGAGFGTEVPPPDPETYLVTVAVDATAAIAPQAELSTEQVLFASSTLTATASIVALSEKLLAGSPPPPISYVPVKQTTYSLVVAARIPNEIGAPSFVEIGPLTGWSGLFWEDAINGEASAGVSVDPHNQPVAVKERLADLADASELWIYRDSQLVFVGPIVGYQPQAGEAGLVTNIHARSLWHYPRRWWVEIGTTLNFADVDQYNIVRGLFNYYQALQYGHFGLSVVSGNSGVLRDRTYPGAENHNIGQRIEELAAVNNGFDFKFQPDTRQLQLGVIGTATDVVLDLRNITDPQAFMSVGPEDLATDAYATAEALTAHQTNHLLRARWGRIGAFETFQGVKRVSTLNNHAQRMLTKRGQMFYEPGPNLIPVAGADVEDFSAGDTIEMVYDYGFSTLVVTRQVIRRQVSVSDTGDETLSVAFSPDASAVRQLKTLDRRVSELEARI